MKKLLLTSCMAVAAMSMSAEVYSFVVDGTNPYHFKQPSQDNLTIIPIGYYGLEPQDNVAPVTATQKALVCDGFMIEDVKPSIEVIHGSYRMYQNIPMQITPAAGLTITEMKFKGQVPNYVANLNICELTDEGFDIIETFTKNDADTITTWQGAMNEPFYIVSTGSGSYYHRNVWFEITVSGESTQVGIPACANKYPVVAKNEAIVLNSSTEGAKIYYTISTDGSYIEPTTESTLYTGPFTLDETAIVRAIAVKDGMTNSFPTYYEFFVAPENSVVDAILDLTDFASFEKEDGTTLTTAEVGLSRYPLKTSDSTVNYDFTGKSYYNNGYKFTALSVGTSKLNFSSAYGTVCEYIATTKKGAGISIDAPAGKNIKAVLMQGQDAVRSFTIDAAKYGGANASVPFTKTKILWSADEAATTSKVDMICGASSNRYLSRIYVLAEGDPSGVDNIIANDENAPVEYYNLQGIRVNNPQSGIYVKRQGSKATKVIM